MCGFCGFTGGLESRESILKAMTRSITHRGPDDEGLYVGDGIAMGFRRLSIIDLSPTGCQPIWNEDHTIALTFNGEIYNYRQLRDELTQAGHTFSTHTDSEVLLHGFEQWGEQLLDRLRGMFAFAIWNTQDRSLFLARDPFGIKPLYYAQIPCGDESALVYASEIKSLFYHPGLKKRLNREALDCYLSFEYVVPPLTMYEDVLCLLPGHFLRCKNGRIFTNRYWEPRFSIDDSLNQEQAVDEIAAAFEDSVAAHRIADVETGCFLSSGVDSSFVSSYFSGQKTFTVGFEAAGHYSELEPAAEFSKKIGSEHHQRTISDSDYWNAIKKVQYHLDQPVADASCIALYFVSKLARQYVKVVLSGEGADELFGGYNIYHEPADLASYQRLPLGLRRALAAVANQIPFHFRGKSFLQRGAHTVEERFLGNCSLLSMKEKRRLLRAEFSATPPQSWTAPHYERVKGMDDITKMQYLDLNVWLVGDILLKADRMSMANSLELRVPFLDRRVWEVASQLPARLRVSRTQTKTSLRQAAQRRVTQDASQRRKLGFPVPIRVWLRQDPYFNLVHRAFSSQTAQLFFQQKPLLRMLERHRAGKEDNSRQIWTVYMFLIWYDIAFQGASHEEGDAPILTQ